MHSVSVILKFHGRKKVIKKSYLKGILEWEPGTIMLKMVEKQDCRDTSEILRRSGRGLGEHFRG